MLTSEGINNTTEKASGEVGVDVRMCKECQHTVFSKKDFALELENKPPDVRAYENLVEFERGIRLLLPKFQRLLMVLQLVLMISNLDISKFQPETPISPHHRPN